MKAIIDKDTGNLIITITVREARALKADIKQSGYVPIEDVLDIGGVIGNGYSLVAPYIIDALTDSPILTDGSHSDDGERIEPDTANFWWYPQYELLDPATELANDRRLEFTKA